MQAKDYVLMSVKSAHKLLNDTIADIKDDHWHMDPGGKASTLAALYAHVAVSEDWVTNELLQKKPKLSDTEFKDKLGYDLPYPPYTDEVATANWMKSVKVDLSVLKEYVAATQRATEDYIASLANEDLDKEIELQMLDKQSLAFIIDNFLIGHANTHTGEISAIKGVHGSKGYPF